MKNNIPILKGVNINLNTDLPPMKVKVIDVNEVDVGEKVYDALKKAVESLDDTDMG